jgi:hypothetical protein
MFKTHRQISKSLSEWIYKVNKNLKGVGAILFFREIHKDIMNFIAADHWLNPQE